MSNQKRNQTKTCVYTVLCTSIEIKVILSIYIHTSVPDRLRPKCCRCMQQCIAHITCELLHLSVPQFAKKNKKTSSYTIIFKAFALVLCLHIFQTYKTKHTLAYRIKTSLNLTFFSSSWFPFLLSFFFFFFYKSGIFYIHTVALKFIPLSPGFQGSLPGPRVTPSLPERESVRSLAVFLRRSSMLNGDECMESECWSAPCASPLAPAEPECQWLGSQSMPKPSLPSLMASFSILCSSS